MQIDYPPDLRSATVEEVLALLRDLHRQQCSHDWAADPFARGAYSWATPRTREAQAILAGADGLVLFSGEALYRGRDRGTVEAALASGAETAGMILRK